MISTRPMTADVTIRFYLFTRGPSAGVNEIDGRFGNIKVGGEAWWNPDKAFRWGAGPKWRIV